MSYLAGLLLLSELLGSSADATSAFSERLDDGPLRAIDIAGAVLLAA